ncbi:hypothetical protein IJG14_07655 [bacterium]|nr:hypothetical protein [bacterium]
MIKLIIKTTVFCFCLYVCYWFAENLDFASIINETSNSLKYEFSEENIKYAIKAISNTLK